ncbi:TIGR04222 domain-containing membrane protein [Pseudonocardia sp. C8]|uniref:TIGR04222 domain-containing membrane protein n=1 Tax=Pseudonocardia sp. C8 TaxID=2762759 RepID=UPI0016436953|nr:TIGR04222 domain-containing membrane protein [Pseudonocardia sp. C8]MBC3193814.1 TIGR04222 domain-containing membrane protein [Pseudonocardia sp. C8]
MGTNLTGETWGVSGPTFLVVYVIIGVTAVALALWRRSRIAAGDPAGGRLLDNRPEDVAYLNGGPELAVYAALSAMHVDGTVVTSGRTAGQVRAGGPLTRTATGLQRAIHRSAHRLTPGRTLRLHDAVRAELDRIGQRLRSTGLLLSADERNRYRATAVLPGLVVVLGVARISAGTANGRPVGFLILLTLVMAAVTGVLMLRAPHRTRAGEAALRRLRTDHAALSPSMRPDWTAVGPAAAALSVGAFGVGAMLAAEPAFAEELAAQKVAALGSGSGSSGGWTGGGDSSSGGGDGGGGGGGCGGGGCGG